MSASTVWLPVTVRCKTCKRLFIEWIAYEETIGKTKYWKPQYNCDECFCQRVSPFYRDEVRKKFYDLSQQMFERFPHADLRWLDPVHTELFKRKLAGLTVGTLDDTFSHLNKSIRSTE